MYRNEKINLLALVSEDMRRHLCATVEDLSCEESRSTTGFSLGVSVLGAKTLLYPITAMHGYINILTRDQRRRDTYML